jgi:perosamine synthetase
LSSGGVPFYKPWITNQDEKAVSEALKSRWLTGGPIAARFENQFADYVGVKYAVSVNSCTAALHLAMRVLNIRSGDEVIVPDVTFAATANAALFVGATPVFADIDEKTFNISPNDVLNKITPKTKVIIPVHYGGQPCDMKELMEIAQDYKLNIVEDCAHSLGSEYAGKKTGSFGVFGCFSFYPTKIITTLEGGMISTNDENFAKKLHLLREHGMSKSAIDRESEASWYYDVVDLGYNYRLNELQAALGSSQLNRVEDGIKLRMDAARYYGERMKFNGIVAPYEAARRSHIYHLYVIKVDEGKFGKTRDELFKKLSDNKVGVSLHYTPLHKLSFYKKFLKNTDKFPVAEQIYRQILSLPLYPTMTENDVDYVVESIGENAVC